MLGKPKEHVEKAIKDYVEHIKSDSQLVILNEEFSQIKEVGHLWGKFVEIDLVIKGTGKLIGFCFEYMPSSLEIVKPEHLTLSNYELARFLNDLQARLHNVDMVVKQQKSENDFLKKNLKAIIENAIVICLKVQKLKPHQISKVTGIPETELAVHTENLIKDGKIKKEGEFYTLA